MPGKASDATPFPSRPRLHSPALAHDTPPELRVLEGVWRNLRRSAPPESPVTAAPLARDFKGKGREQPPQRSSSAGASTDVVRSTRAARTSWADDNKENAGRSWAKQAGRDPWDKQANRARPAASPGRPSREPLGPSSGRPASANLPPAARSLYEHPRQPADAGPRAAPSRQASTTRTASHASTHKTAGSPPTVRFAGEPPGKATARAPSRNPKRKTSSASSSKRPARGSHVPAVDHKHNKDARPDAAPAAAGPRTVSTSSSTAYQPSHLHARLHDFAHLPPSHAGASYPRFSPPPDEYVLDELSLASSGAESSSAAAGRHPAEHPLATLHLAPSSQALKHGHVSILDGRSNGGACVLLWLRDETWALSDDGQKVRRSPLCARFAGQRLTCARPIRPCCSSATGPPSPHRTRAACPTACRAGGGSSRPTSRIAPSSATRPSTSGVSASSQIGSRPSANGASSCGSRFLCPVRSRPLS